MLIDPELCILIKDAVNSCITSIKLKKPDSLPTLGLSKAHDFNQASKSVSRFARTKELQPKLSRMQMVDEFTRYTAVTVIST